MAPVWMPPVTAKFAPSAARPAGVLASTVTGARPFNTVMLVAVCAWQGNEARTVPTTRPSLLTLVISWKHLFV